MHTCYFLFLQKPRTAPDHAVFHHYPWAYSTFPSNQSFCSGRGGGGLARLTGAWAHRSIFPSFPGPFSGRTAGVIVRGGPSWVAVTPTYHAAPGPKTTHKDAGRPAMHPQGHYVSLWRCNHGGASRQDGTFRSNGPTITTLFHAEWLIRPSWLTLSLTVKNVTNVV